MRRFFNKLTAYLKADLGLTILSALLAALYLSTFVYQARVDISLDIETPHNSYFRIYWAAPDQVFSEKRMAYVQVNAHHQDYHFRIASLNRVSRLRIDPIEYAGNVTLNHLNIQQVAYAPVTMQKAADFSPLLALNEIVISHLDPSSGLLLQTTGNDGNLEILLKPQRLWPFPWLVLLGLSLATFGMTLACLTLLTRFLSPIFINLRFVPYLLTVGCTLALSLAMTSGLQIHPDEVVHLSAVSYYAGHLLPPSLLSPDIASSYSVYGHSRLSDYEIYYQLAGYFQFIPKWLNASSPNGARAFSLMLFAWLIAFSFYQKKFRLFALPLLLSAQVWYVYSYTNSDAFALVLVSFTAYLAASRGSALDGYLTEHQPAHYTLKSILLGALFGALLLLKANYYFFILFLGLYLVWRIAKGDFPDQRRLWKRLLVLVLIATSLYGARFAMDIAANGWNSTEVQAQMREHYASTSFKPSTPRGDKNPMLGLKEQGHSLGYMLVNARWFEKSFRSAFGVYGFNDFVASRTYYDLVRLIGLFLIGVLLIATIKSRSRANLMLLIILAASAGSLILASIWISWTAAFQPQGRYLLPILPMFSILYYHVHEYAIPHLFEWLTVILFLLAVYSFVFIGLANMSSLSG